MVGLDLGPEWLWKLFAILVVIGAISAVVWAIEGIIWLFHHVSIN